MSIVLVRYGQDVVELHVKFAVQVESAVAASCVVLPLVVPQVPAHPKNTVWVPVGIALSVMVRPLSNEKSQELELAVPAMLQPLATGCPR